MKELIAKAAEYLDWLTSNVPGPKPDEVKELVGQLYEMAETLPDAGKFVPDSWKMVPVEPTDEMATAAMNAEIHANRVYGEPAAFSDIWRAMLAAAPAVQGEPVAYEEIMVNTPYDVFTLPLQPSGLGGKGPRFVVHVPGPEQPAAPGVLALVEALENAARSLRTISKKAGTGEFMSEMYQVRGYAESRAWCAEEDLAAFRQGGVE